MRSTVSKDKFCAIIIVLLVLIAEAMITNIVLSGGVKGDVDTGIKLISAINAIFFFVELITWYRLRREIISPFVIFFVVMFLFSCGQSLGWIFDAQMSNRDLRMTAGVNHNALLKGLCYTMLGISSFFLGALISLKSKTQWTKSPTEGTVLSAYRSIGKILLIVCVPAFLAITMQLLAAVASGGYIEYYNRIAAGSFLWQVVNVVGDYYQPSLLILLIAYKDIKRYRRAILIAMLFGVLADLYIGGRSGALMTIASIFVAYHYFVKPFTGKQIIVFGLAAYCIMAMSNFISATRSEAGRSIADLFSADITQSNTITDFVGELGWNLSSIMWTMELVPSRYPFRYGMSYLVAPLAVIPSFFFSGAHPVETWAALGDWLQNARGMSYGPGYTMIAEAYANFGWYGFIVLVLEGFIIAKVIARTRRQEARSNTLGSTFQILVIMTIMKSLVRASLSSAARPILLVLLPMYLLIRYTINKKSEL